MGRSLLANDLSRAPVIGTRDVTGCRACLLVDAATLLMAAFASIAIDLLADPEGSHSIKRALLGSLWIISAILVRLMTGRARIHAALSIGKHAAEGKGISGLPAHERAPRLPLGWVALLALVAFSPLALEPMLRVVLGEGRPLEIQLLLCLRNLALGLAALSLWPHCAKLSAAASLCLMLFAQVVDEGKSLTWLLVPFAVAGGFWLLLSYQARFASLVTAASESNSIAMRSTLQMPWRALTYSILIGSGLVGIWAIGPTTRMVALGEWIGASGGTGESDPFARGGVNDGQEEVGGENPETTGFAETDKFLDSEKPTLYDAASDLYGEPVRKKKKPLERMISVNPSEVREIKNHAESKRASREFATARQSPKRPRTRPEDRDARALFELQGRTPLHLRMDVLVDYDGETWKPLAMEPCPTLIEAMGRGAQMRLAAPQTGDFYGSPEFHQVKVASMEGALAPTPTLLSQFRVGLIDRADFFEWRRDGVLGFRGRSTIPSGTTIQTQSRTANFNDLEDRTIANETNVEILSCRDLPDATRDRYAGIARQWAGNHPRGITQVSAIIERLRSEFQFDRSASIATTDGDPVLEFLESKPRGPDYLFASAAVLLLRSQGYSTRLAFGYYASPAAFDGWTRHTPVRETDLHFWPEIRLADGNWLPLEPTPGYDVLLPKPTLAQRIAMAGWWVVELSMHRPILVSALIVYAFALLVFRRRVVDGWLLARLRFFPSRDWRRRVLASVRLLEHRARAVGDGRPSHQSLVLWSARYVSHGEAGCALQTLVALAQVAAYGPPRRVEDCEAICRRAERFWTLSQFRRSMKTCRQCAIPLRGQTLSNTAISAIS